MKAKKYFKANGQAFIDFRPRVRITGEDILSIVLAESWSFDGATCDETPTEHGNRVASMMTAKWITDTVRKEVEYYGGYASERAGYAHGDAGIFTTEGAGLIIANRVRELIPAFFIDHREVK